VLINDSEINGKERRRAQLKHYVRRGGINLHVICSSEDGFLENTAWNSEAVQEDLRNHILKASALDASHIVTSRSGDILVLITISMGKEKSQFSKILIESIHRWNRSQISMRAPPDHFDPFDVFGWDCPVDIDMRESDIRTPTVYEIQRQYARVARLINRAERGEVALPYTMSDLNEARQLFLQRRGNRNTMYDVSERPQQGRYHTRAWNPNADTSDWNVITNPPPA